MSIVTHREWPVVTHASLTRGIAHPPDIVNVFTSTIFLIIKWLLHRYNHHTWCVHRPSCNTPTRGRYIVTTT